MNSYLLQPPGLCYMFVGLQGMLGTPNGEARLRRAVTPTDDGFKVRFEPRNKNPVECAVTLEMVSDYRIAIGRSTTIRNPEWVDAIEVGYNEFLRIVETQHPWNRRYGVVRWGKVGDRHIPLRTVGGNTSDFLSDFLGLSGFFEYVPSRKPRDVRDAADDCSAEDDLRRMREVIDYLTPKIRDQRVVVCAGTRNYPVERVDGLIPEHGYLLEDVESGGVDLSLRLRNLQEASPEETNVPLAALVRHLYFLDGAFIN